MPRGRSGADPRWQSRQQVEGVLVIGSGGLAPARLLCIGAHSDDLEIGCGGTIRVLVEQHPRMAVEWVVLSAEAERTDEAQASARGLLAGIEDCEIRVEGFRERYFQYDAGLKEYFDRLGRDSSPELVLVPWLGDAHQDHRVVAELAANTFRDHLILEYEIPKYDGDLGRPSVYVHLSAEQTETKVSWLMSAFPSQRDRPWFTPETFRALMRLRGVESRAPSGFAEAFHCRKLVLA